MWIIVYWSLNSKNNCFMQRISLFIQSFFSFVSHEKKSNSFQTSVNHWRVLFIYWGEWERPAGTWLKRQDWKQTCSNQPWISALVQAFRFSLKAKVYSAFAICSVSLASPQNFVVPLELDRCLWFTFFLYILCDKRNDIPPSALMNVIFYVTHLI